MRSFDRQHNWPMLIVILSLFVLIGFVYGCGKIGKKEKAEFKPGREWIKDMRARIEDNIQDTDRKNRMLTLIDQNEIDLIEVGVAVRKFYSDFKALGENYNSTLEEFRKVIFEFDARHSEVLDRLTERRFMLRDISTP